MKKISRGIHHITAIVGHPQENMDFYTKVLGLRMVKKTVNFDDPQTYHFYFGNEKGEPGTVITFFPWLKGRKGKLGGGQASSTIYAVPTGAIEFWQNRLEEFNIAYVLGEKFGERYIKFQDPHGLQLEIVEMEEGRKSSWELGTINSYLAIKGFKGVTLLSFNPDKTAGLLEDILGYNRIDRDGEIVRYQSTAAIGNIIDLHIIPQNPGTTGIGTVHHIALRAQDDKDQLEWVKLLEGQGYNVSPIRDRNYFKSIYFREYGGNLFEIATDGPGFTVDESLEELGKRLMLPYQYEAQRAELKKILVPIK